jgi:hypothetical protein
MNPGSDTNGTNQPEEIISTKAEQLSDSPDFTVHHALQTSNADSAPFNDGGASA